MDTCLRMLFSQGFHLCSSQGIKSPLPEALGSSRVITGGWLLSEMEISPLARGRDLGWHPCSLSPSRVHFVHKEPQISSWQGCSVLQGSRQGGGSVLTPCVPRKLRLSHRARAGAALEAGEHQRRSRVGSRLRIGEYPELERTQRDHGHPNDPSLSQSIVLELWQGWECAHSVGSQCPAPSGGKTFP